MPALRDIATERFSDAFLKRLGRGACAGDALDELRLIGGRSYSERRRGARTPKNDVL
jgi:hypothetical protein